MTNTTTHPDTHQHTDHHDKLWLPTNKGTLKQHPYCRKCGMIRNCDNKHAHSIGYYHNILKTIADHLENQNQKLTQIQKRLITQELQNTPGFTDTYATTRQHQYKTFKTAVTKYTPLTKAQIDQFL